MSPEPRAQALIDKVLAERGDIFASLDRAETDLLRMTRGRSLYYDRGGQPLTMREWAMLTESDRFFAADGTDSYRRVAWTNVGPYDVSTVWLGVDHNYTMKGPPIIFESMVFSTETSYSKGGLFGDFAYHESWDQRRYCTEEEALAGHELLVEEVRLTWEATRHIDPRLLPPPEKQ